MTKQLHLVFILTFAILSGSFAAEKYNSLGMDISPSGLKLIERFEGFRDSVYICPGGKPTIGYGHVVKEEEKNHYTGKLTQKDGEALLVCDLTDFYLGDVKGLVKVPITQSQFDALTSFDYNLGATNLGKSTLLKLLNGGEYHKASLQFPLWRNTVTGTYLPGLFKRRIAEMLIFRDDARIPDELASIPTKNVGENLLMVYQALPQGLKDEAQSIYVSYKANLL